MFVDIVAVIGIIIIVLWILVALSGGFRPPNSHHGRSFPGEGHIIQRVARGKSPWR